MSLLEKIYTEEHRIFRNAVRKFAEKNIVPYVDEWEKAGIIPKQVWKEFGSQGFLCTWLPEEYGGSGVGFEYSVIIIEELERVGFELYYNDQYDDYSTIDFRKDGYKYNVMLVAKEDHIECSYSCYKNIFTLIFKTYNKQKISSLSEICKNILLNNGLIKEMSNQD